jgi:PHD/YefM family antitoxin component YafN of YafNO toxin-antitoxin module
MIDRSDTEPLTQVRPNVMEFIRELRKAGQPVVLTINGKAELVVEDVGSLQKLLELVDRLETIESIREGMKDIEEGRMLNLEEFKDQVRKKHGIPL